RTPFSVHHLSLGLGQDPGSRRPREIGVRVLRRHSGRVSPPHADRCLNRDSRQASATKLRLRAPEDPSRVIYGIGAALGWGLADLLAALAGRRAGSIRTAFVAQLFGVIALTLLIPVGHPQWSLSAWDFLVMLGVGVVA